MAAVKNEPAIIIRNTFSSHTDEKLGTAAQLQNKNSKHQLF